MRNLDLAWLPFKRAWISLRAAAAILSRERNSTEVNHTFQPRWVEASKDWAGTLLLTYPPPPPVHSGAVHVIMLSSMDQGQWMEPPFEKDVTCVHGNQQVEAHQSVHRGWKKGKRKSSKGTISDQNPSSSSSGGGSSSSSSQDQKQRLTQIKLQQLRHHQLRDCFCGVQSFDYPKIDLNSLVTLR